MLKCYSKLHWLARGELEELGRAIGAAGDGLAGRADDIHREHAAAEVPLVELAAEDRLVDTLEVAHREDRGHEAVGDVGVLELVAQADEGVVDDAGVIEGKVRQAGDG